jgi:hypothetical protein
LAVQVGVAFVGVLDLDRLGGGIVLPPQANELAADRQRRAGVDAAAVPLPAGVAAGQLRLDRVCRSAVATIIDGQGVVLRIHLAPAPSDGARHSDVALELMTSAARAIDSGPETVRFGLVDGDAGIDGCVVGVRGAPALMFTSVLLAKVSGRLILWPPFAAPRPGAGGDLQRRARAGERVGIGYC